MKLEYNQESFHKEIDMIQSCIVRMNNKSFMIKGWLLSIVAASMALLPERFNGWFVIGFLVIITGAFWYLDAMFLYTEKLYRLKYDWVKQERFKGNIKHAFDLNPQNKEMIMEVDDKPSLRNVIFTKTLSIFYGIIFVTLIILFTVYPFVIDRL